VKVGLSVALVVMALAVPAGAQTVVDGDTIKLNNTTHRLSGIDAPEMELDWPDCPCSKSDSAMESVWR
jgi:endonuclease YncB( thermonuclease family)